MELDNYTMELPSSWRLFNADQLRDKDQDLVRRAVDFLREDAARFADEVNARLRLLIVEDAKWWVPHHFCGGMAVRNLLRTNGFTDEVFGCNLDDVYVGLMELAMMGDGWYTEYGYVLGPKDTSNSGT